MILQVISQTMLQINLGGQPMDMSFETEPVAKEGLNVLDLTMKGGWIMLPILALSIVAVYIFVERWMAILKAKQEDKMFMQNIKTAIHKGDIEKALELCRQQDTPVARMIEKGVLRIGRPLNDVNAAIENVGKLEVFQLEKGLPTLATVAGAAPMIGFLGTVMGMIRAFYDMATVEGGNLNVSLLSNGIYTAMVTTVAGLTVGIIGYLGYNILVAKVDKVVNLLELRTTEFMDLLNEPVM
jgi:biopolymer transport protein ExbB